LTRCISGDEECRTRERRTRNKHRVARPNQSTRDVRTDQAHEANRPCVRNRNRCEEPTHSKKYAPKSDDINAARERFIIREARHIKRARVRSKHQPAGDHTREKCPKRCAPREFWESPCHP
jgi:hypothetical protein